MSDLAVQDVGSPGAPTVLLLPGQANSHDWWSGLRERLVGWRTVTFDYRGTGGSVGAEGDERGWSTSSFAADAVAVLDRLGLDRVHVWGTSMGGRVAQMLAIEHPDRVDRLVLTCSSPGGAQAVERSQDVRRSLAQRDDDARREVLVDLFYTPAWRASGRRTHLLGFPGMSTAATRAHLRVSDGHDAWDRLPSVAAPTLVLHGTDDLMVPAANADLLASRIPDTRVELTPGGRHGFFDEDADVVVPRVAAFLAGE
ncbi:alpha/beta fold hydrolase [Solicola sp. PLA-1-18]|uniref:alpha/beta fold hydrolase n=1 Tax=Solicola sp. PLA-1-18 TaxID=3380532 RepID=UPI003B80E950